MDREPLTTRKPHAPGRRDPTTTAYGPQPRHSECDAAAAAVGACLLALCVTVAVLAAVEVVPGTWWWLLLAFPGVVALVMVLGATPMMWIRPPYPTAERSMLSAEDEKRMACSEQGLDRFWMLGTHNSCHVASLFTVFVPYWRCGARVPMHSRLRLRPCSCSRAAPPCVAPCAPPHLRHHCYAPSSRAGGRTHTPPPSAITCHPIATA